jgi:hypothetical protein
MSERRFVLVDFTHVNSAAVLRHPSGPALSKCGHPACTPPNRKKLDAYCRDPTTISEAKRTFGETVAVLV